MKSFEKQYKTLVKAYNKQLDKLNKANKKQLTSSLEYFVTALQYLRDYFILTEGVRTDGKENMKVATIATAVEEYRQYHICIYKYYSITNTVTGFSPKDPEHKDELAKQFAEEKQRHWKNFWAIVKDNIETWELAYGTI